MTIKSYYNSTTGDNIITLGTTTDGPEIEGDLSGKCTFRQMDDIASGDAFTFESDSAAELTQDTVRQYFIKVEPEIAQSGTASYTAIGVDVTETSLGSGTNYVIDLQVSSSSVFNVTRTGIVSMATGLSLLDDKYIAFGNSPNAYIEYDTNQTNDALQIALDSTNNTLMICNVGNKAGNFAFSNLADPTIVIFSSEVAGTATDEWMAFQHNGNNGVFFTGKGGIQFQQQADVDSAVSTSVFSFDTLGAAEITGASGTASFLRIVPEIDQSATAGYTALEVDVTETATGSGSKYLLDLQVANVSKFFVANDGDTYVAGTLGVGTNAPQVELQIQTASLGTGWEDTDSDSSMAFIGTDPCIHVVAEDAGTWGGAIHFAQVDGTVYENTWTLGRQTNGDGVGDGSIHFKYGTDARGLRNSTLFQIATSGLVTVGTGTPNRLTPGAGDLYVSAEFEVDGVSNFDQTVYTNSVLVHSTNPMWFGALATTQGVVQGSTTRTQFFFGAGTSVGRSFVFGDSVYYATDHGHGLQTNPTIFVHAGSDPGGAGAAHWRSLLHNQTDAVDEIGSGSKVTEHEAPVSLADDASFDLPTSSAGYGFFMVDDGEEYMQIVWKVDGTVQLIAHSTNVDNADTDGYFCAFDNGSAVRIRNRLGSAKTVTFDYHYTTSP